MITIELERGNLSERYLVRRIKGAVSVWADGQKIIVGQRIDPDVAEKLVAERGQEVIVETTI